MMKRPVRLLSCLLIVLPLLSPPAHVRADGVMRPSTPGYPGDFLRHRLSKIDVAFHGQVAVTTIYEEFVNEWDRSVDALFSFPLPADARATEFLYWSNDTLYRAPLRVKEQAPNPGTGEGGIDALLNGYLGSNAIRVVLTGIPPGEAQRIQMQYISLCRYRDGKILYSYPLATSQFTTNPLDWLSVTFQAESADSIGAVELSGCGGVSLSRPDEHHVSVMLDRSKVYLTTDLSIAVSSPPRAFSTDLFASMNDSLGGHFVLFVKPGSVEDSADVLPKNMVFLLDRSSSVSGTTLTENIRGIKACLDRLRPGDLFNIMAFGSAVDAWRPGSSPANPQAIDSAKAYLDALSASGWSDLASALSGALGSFQADSLNDMVLLFSDGRSPLSPAGIRSLNTGRVSIFPVAIGNNPRRTLLEMLAYQNYGFATFVESPDLIMSEVAALFDQISSPLWRNTSMEMGSNAFDVLPRTMQAVYAGSSFFVTGRYHQAGNTSLSIAGMTSAGPQFSDFVLSFPAGATQQSFAEKFWAKEKIDELEREIDVYGPSDSLKQLDIRLSLSYGIRCMYTGYVADRSEVVALAAVDAAEAAVQSFGVSACTDGVTLRWSVSSSRLIREMNIYRADTPEGTYVRINAVPVSGAVFLDRTSGSRSAWYKLEIVMTNGSRIMSSPMSAAGGVTLPEQHALFQNYPNPFNPTTMIRFAIAGGKGAVPVSIILYDALGREVKRLVSAPRAPGTYEVAWNGTDSRGESVASGVYFCRMAAGSYTGSRSLLLVK